MLQKMSSIMVVGPLSERGRIVDILYGEGTIHLVDLAPDGEAGPGVLQPIDEEPAIEVDQLLLKVNGLLKLLPRGRDSPDAAGEVDEDLLGQTVDRTLDRIRVHLGGLDATTVEWSNRKADLELELITLERYARILRRLQSIENAIPELEGFEMTVLLLQKEYAHVLDLIVPKLRELTHNQFEYVAADLDESTVAVITIFNRWYSREVHAFLFSQNVNEVRIPPDYSNMPIDEALAAIEEKREAGRTEIRRIDDELMILSGRWRQDLLKMRRALEERRDELAVSTNFARTDYTFVAKGWIPVKSIPNARRRLREAFEGRAVLTELPSTPEEMASAPTSYDNPAWARPFQFFTRLQGAPRYQEIDPIPFMAIFFPIFFGLIVGDVGYGLCILGLALFLRYRFADREWLRDLSTVFIISSISTIIFGFLFGEFFGDLGEQMGWLAPVTFAGVTWNRLEAMIPLLVLSIAIGVVHILLGLGLGVVNAVTQRNRRHLCEKCGMIGVVLGIILVLLTMMDLLSLELLFVGAAMLGVGLPLLLWGGGIQGAVEIMGTIGNIMSYARLMAIGMASMMLAIVANELAGQVGTILIGALIAVLLHLLNLVMGMFSPFIQSTRLHLVEFNSKFYRGGGRPYRPFGYHQEG
ncbi:MAG: V-type ATPase 116kDa subunit family protein [Methanospirillum sp.]